MCYRTCTVPTVLNLEQNNEAVISAFSKGDQLRPMGSGHLCGDRVFTLWVVWKWAVLVY